MTSRGKITAWLERAPAGVMTGYAVVAAFATYFCVYAFRKPFTAATFQGEHFAGSQIELKTAFVVSQIIGYTLAKYLGIKVCSEALRSWRVWMMVGLVGLSEFALLLFAVLPGQWRVVAILLNGLPLGIMWGLVVRYLEGRRTSDILLAGLSCSFIVASGVFKDIGQAVMAGRSLPLFGIELPNPLPALDEYWMPVATGLLFLPAFLVAAWFLNQLPEPTAGDAADRTEREPMDGPRRRQFLRLYLAGILPLVLGYVFLTALREYRDFYLVDILKQLGYSNAEKKTVISQMELAVGFGVLITMGLLYAVKNHQRALMTVLGVIAAGFVIIGVATLLHVTGQINGYVWAALIGLGGYMAYVPYNSVLFDRLMASTGFVGTAVFAIYVADSAGYTFSISVLLGKDLLAGQTSRAAFLENFSLCVSAVGMVSVVAASVYVCRRGRETRVVSN